MSLVVVESAAEEVVAVAKVVVSAERVVAVEGVEEGVLAVGEGAAVVAVIVVVVGDDWVKART